MSLLESRDTIASSLCIANACKRSAGTGSQWRSLKWFHRFFFPPSFVNSQIAQVNRPKFLERMVSRFKSALLQSLCYFTFFLSQIEDLENSKSFRCEIMKKQPDIISGKAETMNKDWPLLTPCGMYVVKWESSVIDLRIWDNPSYSSCASLSGVVSTCPQIFPNVRSLGQHSRR